MDLKIPKHLARRIEKEMASIGDPESFRIEWDAKQVGGIALVASFSMVWVLRPNGELLEIDMDVAGPPQSLAKELHLTAIVVGCERYPWLRELIPVRSEFAADCVYCKATGRLTLMKPHSGFVWCWHCRALGWLEPDRDGRLKKLNL